MSTLPEDILSSIATNNVSTIASQPAVLSNLALSNAVVNMNTVQQNAVAMQQSMNQLQTAVVGKAVNQITSVKPAEAAAARALMLGAEEMALLRALLEALGRKG